MRLPYGDYEAARPVSCCMLVIRQMTTSSPKSNRTNAGRGLLMAPEVKGKRQMKMSPNVIDRRHRRHLPSLRPS